MLGTAIGRLLLIPGVSPIGVVAETWAWDGAFFFRRGFKVLGDVVMIA